MSELCQRPCCVRTAVQALVDVRIVNDGGDLLIKGKRADSLGFSGIVEMIHLWDRNQSGCVVGYWEVRQVDGEPCAEFRSVHDRIVTTTFSPADNLQEALRLGQQMADAMIALEPVA